MKAFLRNIEIVRYSFSLDALENGSYVIIVDYKGLPMDPANTVLVISDEMKNVELNIVVHGDQISVINLPEGLYVLRLTRKDVSYYLKTVRVRK